MGCYGCQMFVWLVCWPRALEGSFVCVSCVSVNSLAGLFPELEIDTGYECLFKNL